MSAVNIAGHWVERAALGVAGATLVVLPAFLNWIDANDPMNASRAVPFGIGVSLGIAWMIAVFAAIREPDSHWVGTFFKSVGWPGSIMSVAQVFQVSG